MLSLIDVLPPDLVEWHRRHAEVQRELRRQVRRLAKERREARERARAAAATAKRHANRKEIPCGSCSELFVPVRTDAKTCSNKCRQRMHRARHGVTDNEPLADQTFRNG
jgi:hypothetical protein